MFFVISQLFEKYKLLKALKTNMTSNKHKGAFSLQQVLDSSLNNDNEQVCRPR